MSLFINRLYDPVIYLLIIDDTCYVQITPILTASEMDYRRSQPLSRDFVSAF